MQIQQTRGRRRKRWGDAGDDEGNGERARKSRWADSDPKSSGGDTLITNAAAASVDPVMAALGLSSSSAHPTTTAAASAAVGTIPPIGAGAGLDPRATAELTTLQTRLRLANARLSNAHLMAEKFNQGFNQYKERLKTIIEARLMTYKMELKAQIDKLVETELKAQIDKLLDERLMLMAEENARLESKLKGELETIKAEQEQMNGQWTEELNQYEEGFNTIFEERLRP